MTAPQTSPRLDWGSRYFGCLFSYQNPHSLVNRLRGRRMEGVLRLLDDLRASRADVRILDIGGTFAFWRQTGALERLASMKFTLLNLTESTIPADQSHFTQVLGSALELPFADQSFDVVFSNSVIEHVGSWSNQQVMAAEVRRVGRRHIVQTPSFWFPMEPHARLPFFQFLPRSVRAWLIWHFDINYFPRGKSYNDCLSVSDSTLMLSRKEFARLFPDSILQTERLLGLPKSYTAFGGWSESELAELEHPALRS
jgi:2-polyprenyl-3-methyl-5-hydroxy-6-metoxy-1,4-benzoquinol methylase